MSINVILLYCFIILQPKEVDGAPALDAEGVYFICPLCPTSTKRSDMDKHMTSCLETVGGMMLSCIETVLLEGKDLE